MTPPHDARGFALPVILVFLLVGTVCASIGASLASQQVRLSGDLGSSVSAIHAAEGGAAFLVNGLAGDRLDWPLTEGEYSGSDILQVGVDLPPGRPAQPNHGGGRWWVESLLFEGDSVRMRILGEDGSSRVQRRLEVIYLRTTGGSSFPFGSAVVGCNGVNLAGSGRIDSYDSREGPYNASQARANASVSTLSGNISLPGNTWVRGDVTVAGNVHLSGSATVEGQLKATGGISFTGNPSCPAHPVEAGGAITTPGAWWCPAAVLQPGSPVSAPGGTCDPLDVDEFVDGRLEEARPPTSAYQSGNYSGWNPNPIVFEQNPSFSPGFSTGSTTSVTFDSETVDRVFVNGSVSGAGSSTIRIRAPTVPGQGGRITMFVDGDFTLAGGSQLIIEPGAALELVVTGRVNLGGGLVNHNQTPTITMGTGGDEVTVPSFSLYSSFAGTNGVRIGGNTQIFASVYAPRTSVAVTGSGGLYGSVRGGTVEVTGAGGIHYDEALGEAQVGNISDESVSRVTRWVELF